MKKILLILSILIFLLFALMGIIGLFYLGPIVKLGIEQFGPQITKVTVNVDSADVSLLGSASLKGLVVGNPQGYSDPQAIKANNISVSLEPLSVTSNKIMIHSVRVDSPEIYFEAGLSGNNLTKILSNVNAYNKNPGPAPKIEIDDLLITSTKVTVDVAGIASKTLQLPDIHLTDLGKSSDGLTPVEMVRAILNALLTATLKAVTTTTGGISQTINNLAGSLVGKLFSK